MGERAVAIIPARVGSARFPGKVLASETGRPLVWHVYERAREAGRVSRVVVAADDGRVVEAVEGLGGEAVLTRVDHANGTSRVAEAAGVLGLGAEDVIVNVQGDEPEIEPGVIDAAVGALVGGDSEVGTVGSVMGEGEDAGDPNVVKVVRGLDGRALYFSRARVPLVRDGGEPECGWLRHVGVYAYRRRFLEVYAGLEETPLERAEKLEQLRVLEHGYRIGVAVCASRHGGIDTEEQYRGFVERWRARG